MDNSPPPSPGLDQIAEGGADVEDDWGYLGSDEMSDNSFAAFSLPWDIISTSSVSASMLLSSDSPAFSDSDLYAGFPSSSTDAPALPAFHDDFGSSSIIPSDEPAAQFLGAPPQPPPPPPPAPVESQKGTFLLPPPAQALSIPTMGMMGWDGNMPAAAVEGQKGMFLLPPPAQAPSIVPTMGMGWDGNMPAAAVEGQKGRFFLTPPAQLAPSIPTMGGMGWDGNMPAAAAEGQKGRFLLPPPAQAPPSIPMGMGRDGNNMEIDKSLETLISRAITPSPLENVVGRAAAPGVGGGGIGSSSRMSGNAASVARANKLMKERSRRKKLTESLYMLRSMVPNISKMDTTSILSDAVAYVKELLQRVHDLQAEIGSAGANSSVVGRVKEEPFPYSFRPTSLINGQQSTVEVVGMGAEGHAVNIQMICPRNKPGIAQSTVGALDGLGLGVQQSVIRCFSDSEFAMDVFGAERSADGPGPAPGEIKAALMRTAGL